MEIVEEFIDNVVNIKEKEQVAPSSQFVVLDKEAEKHIYDIRNSVYTKHLLIKLNIGNQFTTTSLKINPLQSIDSTFPVKITDTK
jgi:hypothetical protein